MTTLTVTATQTAHPFQGMLLRVKVLTGAAAAASQTGHVVVTSAAYNASIVTTVTGSVVYGAISGENPYTAEPLCTLIDNANDATNGEQYGTFRTTSATGTPGSVLVGSSSAYVIGSMAAAEILAAGTIAEDASAPAIVTSNVVTTLTTASFTPPAGSLLVALVSSDGDGTGITTVAVTDTGGGLTWIPLAQANASNQEYAGVWVAQVPAAAPAAPAPPVLLNPLPPGWFPGSDNATAVPGGIPFAPLAGTTYATPAIQFPATPEASAHILPLLPPGWVPGLAGVTQDPGGIPFYSEPQPENSPPSVPGLPAAPGIPDYLPFPPFWFPGGDKLSGAPGGIPFWVQPQPDSSPALPAALAPPVITGSSADGTYFTDQYGQPRLLIGEDIWDIIINGGRWNGNFNADIGAWAASRAAQGYTAAEVEVFSANYPNSSYLFTDGRDCDGSWPFAGSTDPTTTPNPVFWGRRDYFLSTCAANGITVVFNASTAGLSVVGNWILGWSTAQWQAYGTFLANRYKDTPNILWITGDDYFGEKDTQLTAWLAALRDAGDNHLVAIQGYQETTSRFGFNPTHASDPLSFCVNSQYDWVYTYNPSYNGITYAQQFEPSGSDVVQQQIPPVWGDGFYLASGTGAGQTDVRLERQNIWWALSSGAAGFSTGDNEVYPWLSTAAGLVTSKTFYSSVMPAITSTFRNLPGWQKLVSDWGSALVTSGRGTRAADTATGSNGYIDNTDDYVSASVAADGSLAVIYCAKAFSITIDQSKMAAGYTVTWIDPLTGATSPGTPGSTYNSGVTKGSNSAGDPDWVLVLQGTPAIAKPPGFPACQPLPPGWFPGSDKVTALPGSIPFLIPAVPDPGVAAAANVSVLAGIPTATGAAPAPAAEADVNPGIPTAAGSSAAVTSLAVFAGIPAATGTVTAPSVLTGLTVSAPAATATGTSPQPVAAITGFAGAPSASGSAAAVANAQPTAGIPSATGTSPQPAVSVNVSPGIPAASGISPQPGIVTGLVVNAPAATATGASPAPVALIAPVAQVPSASAAVTQPAAGSSVLPGAAAATGAATAVANVRPLAGTPAATGTATQPVISAAVNAGIPASSGVSPQPVIGTGLVVSAPAVTATGTSPGPVPLIATGAQVASASGAVTQPVTGTSALPGAPAASGSAASAASIATQAGVPAATGIAAQPAASASVLTGIPAATGISPQPGVVTGLVINAPAASVSGVAAQPAVSEAVLALVAVATGAAPPTSKGVLAGIPAASGAAPAAKTALAAQSLVASATGAVGAAQAVSVLPHVTARATSSVTKKATSTSGVTDPRDGSASVQ